jgi:hypothetical protein
MSILIHFLLVSCRSTTSNNEQSNSVVEPTMALVSSKVMTETVKPTETSTLQPSKEPGPTRTAPEIAEPPISATLGPIILLVSKSAYQVGEIVEFTISNSSDAEVYYTYGCSWPIIRKIEDGKPMYLTFSILDVEPGLFSLKPGQTNNCTWHQMAWQDPNRQGNERYQHYLELLQVPSGTYQFWLDFFSDQEDIYSNEKAKSAWTDLFTIEKE